MQPAVQATTRTPGPSTAEPVVNECRKPMSPVASAGADVGFRHVLAEVDAQLERALRRERTGADARVLRHRDLSAPWNVRLMTSICCSRVSRTKLTA